MLRDKEHRSFVVCRCHALSYVYSWVVPMRLHLEERLSSRELEYCKAKRSVERTSCRFSSSCVWQDAARGNRGNELQAGMDPQLREAQIHGRRKWGHDP